MRLTRSTDNESSVVKFNGTVIRSQGRNQKFILGREVFLRPFTSFPFPLLLSPLLASRWLLKSS